MYGASTDILARGLAVFDLGVFAHCERSARLFMTCFRQFGFSDEEGRLIGVALRLHDLGKISLPRALIQAPRRLTPLEYELVKTHAESGAHILMADPNFERVASLVRHHHERWDGAGYPLRLKGEQTPKGSRVMAIFDSYTAMTNGRPYAPTLTITRALEEIRACAGTQFDPDAAAIFCEVAEQSLHPAWHRVDVAIHKEEA